jgi:hypothetical protein
VGARLSIGAERSPGTISAYVKHRLPVELAAILLGTCALTSCSAKTFCTATARGATAQSAISSYVHACGADYRISRGPLNADKSTSAYANYAQVVLYTLDVKDNAEGPVAFLMVGQRTRAASWQTLGPPGTGP